MDKPIHFYTAKDTREGRENERYYHVFLAPYGLIGSVHGFDIAPEGIITLTVTSHIVYEFEVRQALKAYLAK